MEESWWKDYSLFKRSLRRFLQNNYGDIAHTNSLKKKAPIDGTQYKLRILELEKQKKALEGCIDCTLHLGRKNLVFGLGPALPSLLVIGPPPGKRENMLARPFVGEEEELLEKMLRAIHCEKDTVYITPIVKCAARNNLSPSFEELHSCLVHLNRQISLLQPRAILLMGLVAAQTIFRTEASLASIRGVWQDYQGVPSIATWSPSDLIANPVRKKNSWIDLQLLSAKLNEEQKAWKEK